MASEGDISVAPHRCAPLTEFLIEHMYGYLRHPKGQSKAGEQPSEDALWPWEGNCRGRTPASCSSSHLSLEATSAPLMMSRRLAGRSLAVQASVCSRHRAATRPTQRAHMGLRSRNLSAVPRGSHTRSVVKPGRGYGLVAA